jgi:hypothetical protein
MKLAKALKSKNQLAGELTKLKELIGTQNVRTTKQKFDYDNRELFAQAKLKIDEMVKVKTAIAIANGEIYARIFRLAELKGLVTTFKALETRSGIHREPMGYNTFEDVEYAAQFSKVETDRIISELTQEIQDLQDSLDEFNYTRSLDL